jgi:7-cyano-7-deazaguanine reductase
VHFYVSRLLSEINVTLESAKNLELGKKSEYEAVYNADKLFPIPRAEKRVEIGLDPQNLPFYGFDAWNHYEVSWLNAKGKPVVATAEIIYDCHTPNIIESKSLKLYFNTFNNTQFDSVADVENTIKKDLSYNVEGEVTVAIQQLRKGTALPLDTSFKGDCIDDLDVACSVYSVEPSLLITEDEMVEEILFSDLLKSNCLVTYQPDWGSVQIEYKGPKINRESLLKYIVSFRNHNEFHEQCIERIFVDIMAQCKPQELTVYGRYTRRGGLDINPYRSTKKSSWAAKNLRLLRQ